MGQLNAEARSRHSDFARRRQHPGESGFVSTAVNSEATVGNAPAPFDGRGFQRHETRARHGVLHDLLQVPVAGAAVVGAVLAHWRYRDAVL